MHILALSWRDPKHPLAGGAEQVMHEHMKKWVKAGHSVTLFAARFKSSLETEVIDGIKIVRQGFDYLGVQLFGYLYYRKNYSAIDLIIDQFHGLPFFTPLYAKKPIIAVIQETAKQVWFLNPLPFPLNFIIGSIGFLLEPFFFIPYKNVRFITGSRSAKEEVYRFGIPKDNISIVPHGVIVSSLTKKIIKEVIPTITYLGLISKDKGIEQAIEAFYIISDKGHYKFWIIGKAETKEYSKKIEQKIKDLGLDEKITMWGYVNQEKKFELLKRSHLLINPSPREGWGLVNIEANAMGVPVIAYPSQGLIDSVAHLKSGIICKEKTPASLAENVVKALEDRQVYKRLQEGAIEWSQQFSWEKSCAQSLKIIEDVLST